MYMPENNKNNKTTILWEVMKYSDKIGCFSITRWLSVFLRVLYFSYLIVCYRMVFLASIWGVIPIFLQTSPPISMKLTRNYKLKWKRKLSCQRLSFLAACKTSPTRQRCVNRGARRRERGWWIIPWYTGTSVIQVRIVCVQQMGPRPGERCANR